MRKLEREEHLVLRMGATTVVTGRKASVVAEHNAVQQEQGQVVLGKFGAAPASARIAAFHEQAVSGVPTQVFVVRKEEALSLRTQPPWGVHTWAVCQRTSPRPVANTTTILKKTQDSTFS